MTISCDVSIAGLLDLFIFIRQTVVKVLSDCHVTFQVAILLGLFTFIRQTVVTVLSDCHSCRVSGAGVPGPGSIRG